MKAIHLNLENEDVRIDLWEYEKFEPAEKALVRDLILWLNGADIESPIKIKEAEPAD